MLAGLWWGFIHGAHDYFEGLAGLQGIRFGARQYHYGAGGTSSGLRMKFPLFLFFFTVLSRPILSFSSLLTAASRRVPIVFSPFSCIREEILGFIE